MEIKKRETTLEVLKRLQAENVKPIPNIYKKPPVKIKVEDIVNVPVEQKVKIKPTGKSSEAIILLNQIKDIEKQLKVGKDYFDHYYDLRKKEDELLRLYESLQNKGSLPEEVLKKIKEIKRKFKFNK